jgi:hypothetical protein
MATLADQIKAKLRTSLDTITGWVLPVGDLLPANLTMRLDELNAKMHAENAKGLKADRKKLAAWAAEARSINERLRNVSRENIRISGNLLRGAQNIRNATGFGLTTIAGGLIGGVLLLYAVKKYGGK